jgi:hypothetical protein
MLNRLSSVSPASSTAICAEDGDAASCATALRVTHLLFQVQSGDGSIACRACCADAAAAAAGLWNAVGVCSLAHHELQLQEQQEAYAKQQAEAESKAAAAAAQAKAIAAKAAATVPTPKTKAPAPQRARCFALDLFGVNRPSCRFV